MAAILAEIVQIIDQSAFSFPTGFLLTVLSIFLSPIVIQYFGCYHVVDIKSARTHTRLVLLAVEQRQRYASKKPAALKVNLNGCGMYISVLRSFPFSH
jgi:hypothetical protein